MTDGDSNLAERSFGANCGGDILWTTRGHMAEQGRYFYPTLPD